MMAGLRRLVSRFALLCLRSLLPQHHILDLQVIKVGR
jgi:hypothetical protein